MFDEQTHDVAEVGRSHVEPVDSEQSIQSSYIYQHSNVTVVEVCTDILFSHISDVIFIFELYTQCVFTTCPHNYDDDIKGKLLYSYYPTPSNE